MQTLCDLTIRLITLLLIIVMLAVLLQPVHL